MRVWGYLREELPYLLQVVEADKIVALDASEHRPLMQQRFPAWREQVEYWEIHDVEVVSPTVALRQIEQHVKRLLKEYAY